MDLLGTVLRVNWYSYLILICVYYVHLSGLVFIYYDSTVRTTKAVLVIYLDLGWICVLVVFVCFGSDGLVCFGSFLWEKAIYYIFLF